MTDYRRGDIVRVLAYKDAILTRRVWSDDGGVAIAICTEDAYQQAILDNTDPRRVGWRREDVLEIVSREPVVS